MSEITDMKEAAAISTFEIDVPERNYGPHSEPFDKPAINEREDSCPSTATPWLTKAPRGIWP